MRGPCGESVLPPHSRDLDVQPAAKNSSPLFFLTKSLPEIADWVQAQRAGTGEGLNHSENYSTLRQQFGQLSHRWHPLLTNSQLRQPHLTAVHQLAVRALDISKLIYAELENERQGQSKLAPELILGQLLELNSHLLDRVTAQLALIDSTINYAEELHEAARKLVVGQKIAPVWLVSLARRLQLEMRPQPELWQWLPHPGLTLSACLEPRTWNSEAEVYATGIQSARLIAWLGSHHPALDDHLELLIAAALLQDIGFLRLERSTQRVPSQLEVRNQPTYRRHPSLGAGLVAGVGDYSIELSFLIAQHHERLDGTGYPHGLNRYRLSKESQLLACLVRFQELRSRQPAESSSAEAATLQAAFQLYLESAQGAWSAPATRMLLEALHLDLPKTVELALATGQPFLAESFLEKRWTCHPADADVPAPHFLFSRSRSFSRFTNQTVSRDSNTSLRHDSKG